MAGSNYTLWSPTTATNKAAVIDTVDWRENVYPPSQVNDNAAKMMAVVRYVVNDLAGGWLEYGDGDGTYTLTYVGATQFRIDGIDVTAIYHVGRRIRLVATTPGTIYGTITASSFATNTTLTISWDSGSLSNEAITSVMVSPVTTRNALPLADTNGNELLKGSTTASAVNEITVGNAATGKYPFLSATGDDTNISALIEGKGTGAVVSPLANLQPSLIGGYLDWSVGSSALTVAIKTWDGGDPSATEPVYVQFRSATLTTSSLSFIKITAATSLVISSGSTLGTIDSVAFRVWAVGFDDGGTFRLGAVQCVTSVAGAGSGRDVTRIFGLSDFARASSTAEGGAGAADSPATFYTGTAVTTKAYSVLGYGIWGSGLATAGTWASGPTTVQLYGAGVPLPGTVLQVRRTDTGAVSTGTTTIPDDDTIPQNTEGDEYMTQAITPSSSANALRVAASAMLANSNAGPASIVAALFIDSTANALKVGFETMPAASYPLGINLSHMQVANTGAAVTFKVRAGAGAAGTTTFNGAIGARKFGGVSNSYLHVEEIMT